MDREFWLDRWHSNRIGFHLEEVNPHLLAFWPEMPVASDARVFVPLCGKSVDMHWLAEQGHRVIGVEISEQAVSDFFEEQGLAPDVAHEGAFVRYTAGNIEILWGDFFDLDPQALGPVDVVFDRASLIALPPSMREQYVAHLRTLLPHRPPTLLVTLEYDQTEMSGPPFAVREAEVRGFYEADYRVSMVRDWDVLAERPGFRESGLTALHERVYRLLAD
jgi:thiopurine S-methyltransferase